jgi:hypothetical protein
MARHENGGPEQRRGFGEALAAIMQRRGIKSIAELARRGRGAGIDKKEETFGTWVRGTSEPSRHEVLILEEILETRPGALSRWLGWVPVGVGEIPSIEDAIIADDRLSVDDRIILLKLVHSLLLDQELVDE